MVTGAAVPAVGRPPIYLEKLFRALYPRGGRALRPGLLAQLEHGQEGLLGHLDPPDLLHPLLALLLLLEQLALAGDVAAVALGGDVLAVGLDRLAGHDPGT